MARKKKEKVSKDVAVRDNTLPTDVKFNMELSADQEIDKKDIQIPKLWLMQQMSEMVTSGVASGGEFRDSLTNDLVSEEDKMEVILFAPYKSWQVSIFKYDKKTKRLAKKSEYLETLNYFENPDLQYEEEDEEGNLLHRDMVLGFYCLLVKDLSSEAFPYVIDFKRTSRRAGQGLITKIAKLRAHGMPCYAKTFNIGSKAVSGDLGEYFVKTCETGRNITQDEVKITEQWLESIKAFQAANTIDVDDSDVKAETTQAAPKGKAKAAPAKKGTKKKVKF